MNPRKSSWVKTNGPLVVLGILAVIALLSLGDTVVRDRQSRISLTPIIPTITKDDPTQGGQDTQGVIIEFADFSCDACKDQADILKTIINDLGDQVLVVWKDAPLDQFKPEAMNASIASHCAGKQGKFWEMHDKLFEKQAELQVETYLAVAKELQLDEKAFQTCYEKQQPLEKIQQNIREAEDAKITSTPTLIINNAFYEGVQGYEDILSALTN